MRCAGVVGTGRGFKALDRLWDCGMRSELNRELCAAAARNNAVWCDAMARLHGAAGAFTAAAWVNRRPAPRFHPNLVTLIGPHEERAHRDALDMLLQSPPHLGGRSNVRPPGTVKSTHANTCRLRPPYLRVFNCGPHGMPNQRR